MINARQALPRSSRVFFSLCWILFSTTLIAQDAAVKSAVYNWKDLKVEKKETNDRRQILEGATTDLALLEIHATTLPPGKAPHPPHVHDDIEELIIVKEGKVKITIKGVSKILGQGSIAYALPGDEHGIENAGETQATYYVLKFKSKTPMDKERGAKAGGSFMVDWNDVKFTESERGGRRNVYDRATTMFSRFEMHVTTLNKGLASHAPHTHRAEEIVLLIRGTASMHIGENPQNPAEAGAVVFLGSMVPHALQNTTDGQVEYFAFQWQQ